MTREKRISALANLRHVKRWKYKDGLADETIDICIELLEQDPCEIEAAKLQQAYDKGFEDCRQAAIEAVKQAIYNHDKE